MSYSPERIVCLSSETVELMYALNQQHRIAGITAFARYPVGLHRRHPVVSGFSSAKVEKILAVKPDLILAYSYLQTDIVDACIKAGVEVHVFTQSNLAGILGMIDTMGRLLDCVASAAALRLDLQQQLENAERVAQGLSQQPRVYFEEWDEPMITGIQWVSELIALAGGVDVFAARARSGAARDRVVSGEEVLAADPQVIIGSWCGKKFLPESLALRPEWNKLPALQNQCVFEIASHDILVPGMTAITRGLPQLRALIQRHFS
ncbi:MAG: ABC transporter substrate-binding protein [Pseudomonadales bacterium]|nr:ABC transporter substrate-binding protein [Pseudomonadales bacterium]